MAWPKGAARGPDGKPILKAGNSALGDGDAADGYLDPAELGGSPSDAADSGTGDRKPAPGRKTPAPAAKKAKTVPVNVDGVSKILLALHTTIAVKTGDELWLLDDKEAKMLAAASAEVAKYYDLGVPDKYVALGGLGYALSAVYGPRIVGSMARAQRGAPMPPPAPRAGSAFDQLRAMGGQQNAAH